MIDVVGQGFIHSCVKINRFLILHLKNIYIFIYPPTGFHSRPLYVLVLMAKRVLLGLVRESFRALVSKDSVTVLLQLIPTPTLIKECSFL